VIAAHEQAPDRLLAAHKLTTSRMGWPVFQPVDLELLSGRCIVITGANGAGKTTLLRTLAGFMVPHTGTVDRADCRYVGHLPAVKGDLTCRENLKFHRDFGGSAPGQSVETALVAVGLAGLGLRPARTLSAGQRKRLSLARLLVSRQPLWLLDEPYASLDEAGGGLLDNLLAGHLASGGGIVLATHLRMPSLPGGCQTLEVLPAEPPE